MTLGGTMDFEQIALRHLDAAYNPELPEFVQEFEPPEDESDDDVQRLRAFQRNARSVARQTSLDPGDDMGV
jgi:hypothetical protein